jgi:hypothetical protein
VGLHRHGEHSRRSNWQSRPSSVTSAANPSRLARPRRSSSSNSSGQRFRPLAAPWVRLASQNPPLRPDAAQPICWPSSRTTRAAGLRRLARTAVQSPAYPPPTTVRSAVAWPTSGPNRGAGALSCSQNTSRRLPTSAASTRAGDGALSS